MGSFRIIEVLIFAVTALVVAPFVWAIMTIIRALRRK